MLTHRETERGEAPVLFLKSAEQGRRPVARGSGERVTGGGGQGRHEHQWVQAPSRNRSAPREVTQGRLAMETGETGDWCSGGGGLRRRESSSAVVVQWGSTKGSSRTCWCPWRGPAWPVLSWPWQQPTMARTAPAARSSGGPQRRGKGVEALGGPYNLNGGPSSASNGSWCTGHVRPRQCRRRRHDGGVAAC
jgi:hypothetical protein